MEPFEDDSALMLTIGDDTGLRLDKALAALVPEEAALSRSRLMRMIAEGAVSARRGGGDGPQGQGDRRRGL